MSDHCTCTCKKTGCVSATVGLYRTDLDLVEQAYLLDFEPVQDQATKKVKRRPGFKHVLSRGDLISNMSEQEIQEAQAISLQTASRSGRSWEPFEDELLLKFRLGQDNILTYARLIGRTFHSVRYRISQLHKAKHEQIKQANAINQGKTQE